MTRKERDCLSLLAGEPCNPRTVAEYNAWLDTMLALYDGPEPEQRLLAAALRDMHLPE